MKVFKLDREKKQAVLQNAWTFVNDSISTTLCLIWEPEVHTRLNICSAFMITLLMCMLLSIYCEFFSKKCISKGI